MSTRREIEAALVGLTDHELKQFAADVDRLCCERKGALIYQDGHRLETEAELLLGADRAFQEYDLSEPFAIARRCNLLEDDGEPLPVAGSAVTLPYRPDEIISGKLSRSERCR